MAFSKGKRGKNTKWTSAFANIPVGAGFACPNAPSNNRAVGVFERANPAPTVK